jgi:hypothetical protein
MRTIKRNYESDRGRGGRMSGTAFFGGIFLLSGARAAYIKKV